MTTEQRRARSGDDHESPGNTVVRVLGEAGDGVRGAAGRVGAVAGDVATRIPDAAAATRAAADETSRVLGHYPDDELMLGAAFSLGIGAGMFLAGTNRALVMLALAPAIAMGMTLAGRAADARPGQPGRARPA